MSTFTTILVTSRVTLLYGAQGSTPTPVQIRNTDTANTLYVGNQSALNTDGSNSTPLKPGDSVSFDGSVSIYGVTTGPSIIANIVPGGVSFSPGSMAINGNVNATVSGNVNVTNTPNVNITSGTVDIAAGTVDVIGTGGTFPPGANAQVDNATNITITPGSSQSGPVVNVSNYLGYNVNIQAYVGSQNVAGAALALSTVITWYADVLGTVPVYRETWESWLANSAGNVAPVNGAGQMHGPYMRVMFLNQGTVSNVTVVAYTMWGTQRLFNRSDWRQSTPAGMNSGVSTIVPLPSVDGSDGILAGLFAFNMPANAAQWLPLPLMAGPVSMRFQTSQMLASSAVIATGAALLNGNITFGVGTPGTIWLIPNVAGQESTTEIIAPNSPLFLAVKSTASAPAISFAATSVGP